MQLPCHIFSLSKTKKMGIVGREALYLVARETQLPQTLRYKSKANALPLYLVSKVEGLDHRETE